MRSLYSKLLTGMWIRDWRAAYKLAQYHARLAAEHSGFAAMCPATEHTPHEWISAVLEEAKFRQAITYTRTGMHVSLRVAIRSVIEEVTRPGKPAEVRR